MPIEADTADSPPQVDPALYRRTLSEFASGVTVITGGDQADPVGFVCQSFSSVSLSPALVMFCVDHASRTWPKLRTLGRFCVNILAQDQEEICWSFGSKTGRKFESVDWEWTEWSTPAIKGTLAQIHCGISAIHTEGDHDIVIGKVLSLQPAAGRKSPMVFFRGTFDIDAQASATMRAWDLMDGWI